MCVACAAAPVAAMVSVTVVVAAPPPWFIQMMMTCVTDTFSDAATTTSFPAGLSAGFASVLMFSAPLMAKSASKEVANAKGAAQRAAIVENLIVILCSN